MDLVVVHCPVGGGHASAGRAVAEAARARGLSVEVINAFEYVPRWFSEPYLAAHFAGQRAAPAIYGQIFDAANHRDGTLEPLRRGLDHFAFARLVREVVGLNPRAVIATHHLPLLTLGRARRKGTLDAKLTGVVTDFTAHAAWAEKGVDTFCVAGAIAARDLSRFGVSPHRIDWTGIPVRPAFEAIPRVKNPDPGEPLRVLVTSGGFGIGPLAAIVKSFAGAGDVELTVVCGNAKGAARRVARAARSSGVRAQVIGFECDMPARLANAHVVVGKAGGLTVSETLTAGRALVVTGTVPGNERVNEGFVLRTGAGIVARPADVGQMIATMREEGSIASMGAHARAAVIHESADRVLRAALADDAERASAAE